MAGAWGFSFSFFLPLLPKFSVLNDRKQIHYIKIMLSLILLHTTTIRCHHITWGICGSGWSQSSRLLCINTSSTCCACIDDLGNHCNVFILHILSSCSQSLVFLQFLCFFFHIYQHSLLVHHNVQVVRHNLLISLRLEVPDRSFSTTFVGVSQFEVFQSILGTGVKPAT